MLYLGWSILREVEVFSLMVVSSGVGRGAIDTGVGTCEDRLMGPDVNCVDVLD